jgi:peptidyl-prolyl cis-trans isomerase D
MALRGISISKGFVWVILALLIVGLAGFGATNLSGTVRSVGAVGDKQIDVQRYVRALQEEMRRVQQQVGQPISFQQAEAFGIDQQVLQQLLVARAIDHEASGLGLSIGDENLRQQVVGVSAFQSIDGSFSRDNYRFALENAGLSEAEFEANMREETARSLIQAAVVSGLTMPDSYANQLLNYIGERRNFTWARIDATNLDAAIAAPTETVLQAFYSENLALYTTPEIKQISYVQLTPAQLVDGVEVSVDAIAGLYEARDAEFNKPERRLVDRLAFVDATEASQAKAQIEVDAISFDRLVEDRGLALTDVDMGDLDQVALGAAGVAVFAAELDQVVGPFDTEIGPALFRVNGILKAQATSLEAASGPLRNELALDLARAEIDEQVANIDDLLAAGATLEELAGETEMELQTVDWHSEVSQGLAAYQEFKVAAATVTEDGFPKLIALPDGGVFALRLNGIVPPAPKPLETVREAVVEHWTKTETMAHLRRKGEALSAGLTANASFESLDLRAQTEIERTRRDYVEGAPNALITQVFDAATGTITILDDADSVVLVRLDAVLPRAQDVALDGPMRDAINAQATNDLSQDIFAAFARDLQTRIGFELDQQALNAVHAQFQ